MELDLQAVDEMIVYLQRQIDPHDPYNPCYRLLQQQLDKLLTAKALVYYLSSPRYVLQDGQFLPLYE